MRRLRNVWLKLGVATAALLACGGCPVVTSDPPEQFVSITEHGFDQRDHAQDFNDYPWSMAYFQADGEDRGFVYVGTGNSIVNIAVGRFGLDPGVWPLYRPPEIRRYRPDLGPKSWEKVFDYRDIEDGPDWQTSGFRGMAVYRSATDGVNWLYAGTFGNQPTLWRSRTGDSGSWEAVWSSPHEGSIRSLTVHDGRLYFAVSHESGKQRYPGEIYVTDGETIEPVVTDGFGNPLNWGIYSLASFNGYLYAGTFNREEGYELWKLEGPDASEPRRVIAGGATGSYNHGPTQMVVFKEHLYVPAFVSAGYNHHGGPLFKAADMIRLDADDNMEVVVGPGSVTGIESGFGDPTNAYLWSMVVHEGRLYCGTWDVNAEISLAIRNWPLLLRNLPALVKGLLRLKERPELMDQILGIGAELFVSSDGLHWDRIFNDGLGNPDNYGVRNMLSVGDVLYIGMANPVDGLEIFEMR